MKSLITLFSFLRAFFSTGLLNKNGSFQITTAFTEGFRNNIMMLSQQKDTRVFGYSRVESQTNELEFFERLAETEAVDILDRHGNTPQVNSEHSRRAVALQDADWGDLIDKVDRVRMLINPDDAYVQNAVMALNRKKDDIFIAAALGNAQGGRRGTDSVALPDSQKIVSVSRDGTGAVNLNVFTLTLVQALFDLNDVYDDEMKYFAFSGSQKQSMLNQERATSQDFASVKALVEGRMDTFMGFMFRRSERLPVTADVTEYNPVTGAIQAGGTVLPAGARRCFAWCKGGMLSTIGNDIMARISERDDKRYSTQVYAMHSVGATRMEEEKVIEVICTEG